MFIYKQHNNFNLLNKNTAYFFIYYSKHLQIDKYNLLYLTIHGMLIWFNLLHINIILIKFSFLILVNNLEYLILFLF